MCVFCDDTFHSLGVWVTVTVTTLQPSQVPTSIRILETFLHDTFHSFGCVGDCDNTTARSPYTLFPRIYICTPSIAQEATETSVVGPAGGADPEMPPLNIPDNGAGGDDDTKEESNVLSTLKEGTTLMKYGRYGKPKYRMFQLSKDHKYLVWFSPKKDAKNTRVPIAQILQILIGEDSAASKKTKNKEIQETSFTVVYGKSQKSAKKLTVTAKNEKEAYVWAQGLKILSDAAKLS